MQILPLFIGVRIGAHYLTISPGDSEIIDPGIHFENQ